MIQIVTWRYFEWFKKYRPFAKGLSSPDCTAILVNCIKNVEKSIVEIFSKTDETKNSQIKGEQQLLELNKTIILIFEKFSEYEREKVEIEKIMKDIQIEIKDISATIQSFKGGRINIPGQNFC